MYEGRTPNVWSVVLSTATAPGSTIPAETSGNSLLENDSSFTAQVQLNTYTMGGYTICEVHCIMNMCGHLIKS